MDLNNATFTGRLTRDAEVQTVGAKGTIITKFAIANNTGFGQYARTNFINVEVWGRAGEAVAQYLKKGKQVGVTGTFENKRYTGKDGVERDCWTLTSQNIILLADSANRPATEAESSPIQEPNLPGFTF